MASRLRSRKAAGMADMKILAKAVLPCALGLAAAGGPAAAVQRAQSLPFEVEVKEAWSTFGDPGFGYPQGMLQWADGTVWVGDEQTSEVWELSGDGAAARRVLREGEGPGELRYVHRIVPHRDGGAVVHDSRGFLFFGADKKFTRQMRWPVPIWSTDLVAIPDGNLIVSGAFGNEDHELARWAVHRIDRRRGWHVKSWHPAADHKQWTTVRETSGGPIALTGDGGLLVSDRAPFRIVRYSDLMGGGAQLVIEDEGVVSASELDRAVTYTSNSFRTTTAWTQSVFVHEMEDGDILNVVVVHPEEPAGARATTEWLVVSPDGRMLARTPVAKAYYVWNAAPDGHYLATYWDYDSLQFAVAKLEVVVSPRS